MADSAVVEGLVLEHWGLAESMARTFARKGGHPQWTDDLRSAALMALWQAAERWEPGCGGRFAALVVRVITWRLIDEWRRVQIGKGHTKLQPVSLSELFGDDDDGYAQWLEDPHPGPEDEVVSAMAADSLVRLVASIESRDGKIARRYWSGGEWLWEIAADVGVTESRISQIVHEQQRRLWSLVSEEI